MVGKGSDAASSISRGDAHIYASIEFILTFEFETRLRECRKLKKVVGLKYITYNTFVIPLEIGLYFLTFFFKILMHLLPNPDAFFRVLLKL